MSEEIFEGGDAVTDYTVALPTGTTEAPTAYPYGTLLTLTVEARVKGFSLHEDRKGNLIRKHALAAETVEIIDSLTPAQAREIHAELQQIEI